MFKQQEFKKFVKSCISKNCTSSNSLSEEQILNAMCQFIMPAYQFLNISRSNWSTISRRIFKENLYNKPNSVSINIWFLYLFDYKKCSGCKLILDLLLFSRNKNTWNKLNDQCKECNSQYNQGHKKERRNWRIVNKDKVNFYKAKYRAVKLNATPKWLTKQNLIEIQDIYFCCSEYNRLLEEQYHVDHIIPLQGEYICGLHVPWNLQILTAKENQNKGNKY